MVIVDGKVLPDYQLIDGLRFHGGYSEKAVRDTINHKPKPGDIFIATYPKCGTTWTTQIIHTLLNDAKPIPALEFMTKCPYLEITGVDALDNQSEPRFAKIHLPFQLTPYSQDAKYIFVIRNPKDALVSFFHHSHTVLYDFQDGKFDDYFELFINGQVDYGDYFDHVLSWYEQRHQPNILFLYYEKMKEDITSTILRIAKFLGSKYEALVEDPRKLADIVHYSSFQYMKENINEDIDEMMNPEIDIDKIPMASGMKHFMRYLRNRSNRNFGDFKLVRKGIIGDGKATLSADQNRRFDDMIEKRLKGTELYDYWKSIGCI